MVDFKLPPWYPLQDLKNVNFSVATMSEIERYVEERIETQKSKDINKITKSTFETREQFEEKLLNDRKGFALIKMGVAMDPKLSAWFVEVEGDLFQKRFMSSSWEIKKQLLNELFPFDNQRTWLPLEEIEKLLEEDVKSIFHIADEDIRRRVDSRFQNMDPTTGNSKMIGIDFRYANFMVKTRRGHLYKGWVIDSIENLSTTIKKRFERRLDEELEHYAERIETEAPGPIKRLSSQLNEKLRKMVRTRREYDFSGLNIKGSYEENMDLYPACIQDLLGTVNEVGYIPHWERFQLGLFLKHTGMEVDEQLEFWFSKAVDNINISFSDFKKKAGYIIRHIYGLEGAKIDYEMPSCNTIQTKMYCTFRHKGIEDINEKIRSYMKNLEGSEQAVKLQMAETTSKIASDGFANIACARYLELVTGARLEKVLHPLQYLRMAAEKKGLPISSDEVEGETDADAESTNNAANNEVEEEITSDQP